MRLASGSLAPDFAAESIGGRRVSLEQLRGRPAWLKFDQFATRPVCNLHMHRFIQAHQMVADAGLTTVVFYHPPAGKLAEAQDYATPFDLVPDPDKRIFRAYRVERGLRGLVFTGNPADFVIDADGRVVFAHYGKHYADSLEAADIVNAWRAPQRSAARPRMEVLMDLMAMGAAL